ncbi:YjcZ family sporulation protein [Scopulibacillus cellulosilyticus]|uniref:YjcZ family sporulation protein n=1 Tax=Scopulibacillus cellulosilyticus TaxID=2665665 RepID=A0ABW2PT95_9BACL
MYIYYILKIGDVYSLSLTFLYRKHPINFWADYHIKLLCKLYSRLNFNTKPTFRETKLSAHCLIKTAVDSIGYYIIIFSPIFKGAEYMGTFILILVLFILLVIVGIVIF